VTCDPSHYALPITVHRAAVTASDIHAASRSVPGGFCVCESCPGRRSTRGPAVPDSPQGVRRCRAGHQIAAPPEDTGVPFSQLPGRRHDLEAPCAVLIYAGPHRCSGEELQR
jgi:hypothetical protein